MIAFVPAIVLTGMTGPTSLRGGVSIAWVGVRAEPNLGGGGPKEFALGSGRCVVGLVFQVAQTKREQERRSRPSAWFRFAFSKNGRSATSSSSAGMMISTPSESMAAVTPLMMNQSPAAGMVSWK